MKSSRKLSAQHGSQGFDGVLKTAVLAAGIALLTMASLASAQAVEVEVLRSDPESILVEYRVSDFFLEPVSVNDVEYSLVDVGDEAPLVDRGAPQLPSITRSFIIPDDAQMRPTVVAVEYEDIQAVDIAPSRGIISRQVDPSSVPYQFGPTYIGTASFPRP